MTSSMWDRDDVAALMGVSPRTVSRLAAQKRIPCIRLSSRIVRFDPDEIRAWVKKHHEEPPSDKN